jgi:hypothetical protein
VGKERRSFFKSLLGEVITFCEEARGRPQMRLAELDQLPDETLARLMPEVSEDCEVIVEKTEVQGRNRRSGEVLPLFALEPANTITFNRFNGMTPLGDIGHQLAEEMGWEEAEGFAYARNLFLSLARQGVCVPSNFVE